MENSNTISIKELKGHALEIRKNIIKMVARNGQGYVQQGLGATDIFTALYFLEANLNPDDTGWDDRDRIFLSTAHNSALFHATLAQRGIISIEDLEAYTKDDSPLEINVDRFFSYFSILKLILWKEADVLLEIILQYSVIMNQ